MGKGKKKTGRRGGGERRKDGGRKVIALSIYSKDLMQGDGLQMEKILIQTGHRESA